MTHYQKYRLKKDYSTGVGILASLLLFALLAGLGGVQ